MTEQKRPAGRIRNKADISAGGIIVKTGEIPEHMPGWKRERAYAALCILLTALVLLPAAACTGQNAPESDTETEETAAPVIVCSVTVLSDGCGTASADRAEAEAGETVALTAEPQEGYRFAEWRIESGDGTVSGDVLTLGEEDTTVAAVFEAIEYTVKVTDDGHGTAGADRETGIIGDTVKLSAEPEDGYRLLGWEIESGDGVLDGDELVLGTEDTTVRAVFEAIEYAVTVTDDGHGTAGADRETGMIGDTVKLSAEPEAGYLFREWKVISGDGTVNGDVLTLGKEDTTVQAVFDAILYRVTVLDDGHGKVSADHPKAQAGSTVALTAEPEKGYRFSEWKIVSGDGTVAGNTLTLGLQDTTVKAFFDAVQYKVTVAAGEGGTARADRMYGVIGYKITLNAYPGSGWHLKGWEVVSGGVEILEDGSFLIGDRDVEVKAVFEEDVP